jgi:hypothetical protein
MIFAWPSSVSITFAGLRSRWTIPSIRLDWDDTRALYVDSAYGQTVPKAKPLSRSAGTRRAVASTVCR